MYIGNLSPSITEADLRQLFSRAGKVMEVQLILDPATQQSRGYAFVTMATPESAAVALRDFHSYNLGGRYITVTEARLPETPKGLMSEGFNFGSPTRFRSGTPQDKPRRQSRRRVRGRRAR